VIVLEEERHQTAAEPADSVEEHEVNAVFGTWHLRG